LKIHYYKELDGVRALAVLMVMFFHFFQSGEIAQHTWQGLQKISIFGQTGVTLFFILSGFLITRILLATKNAGNYFSSFYIRRTLRIFPLYYLYLLLFYFLFPSITGQSVVPFSLQVYNWVYLQDFAQTFKWKFSGPDHFWSLAVEEHFYLFWPFLIYFFDKRKIIISIFLLIAVSFLVRIYLLSEQYEVYYFTFSRMDDLALGSLLAILEVEKKLDSSKSGRFIFLFAGVLVPTILMWTIFSGAHNTLIQVIKFNLISLVYFSLIGCIISVKESSWVKKLFKINPLLYTGKISYGLYVYHPACFWLFSLFIKTNSILFNFFGSFAFAYLTATLSYYLIEQKFLGMKKYFEYKKGAVALVVARNK